MSHKSISVASTRTSPIELPHGTLTKPFKTSIKKIKFGKSTVNNLVDTHSHVDFRGGNEQEEVVARLFCDGLINFIRIKWKYISAKTCRIVVDANVYHNVYLRISFSLHFSIIKTSDCWTDAYAYA